MKKYLILTSVLAIAACGGSGGGAISGDTPGITPTDTPVTTPKDTIEKVGADVIKANANLTAMASEILIADDGSVIYMATPARKSAGRVMHDGKEYKSYRLNDVKFTLADAMLGDEEFSLSVNDKGQIDGINFRGEKLDLTDGKSFDFTIQHPEFGTATTNLTYDSHAKKLGLRYADFGVITAHAANDTWFSEDEIMPFIGGYDVKHIETADMADATFVGTAHGAVNNDYELIDENAKLVFNKTSGSETLTASFNNWYDVEIVKNGKDIDFKHDKLKGDGPALDGNPTAMEFQTGYYGDHGTAQEAVGLFDYWDDFDNRVTIGFGGKK